MSNDSNRFNLILVVDSIPAGELNSAKRLFEDVQTYAAAHAPSPAVELIRIESADKFILLLRELVPKAREHDVIPLLHIECHGDEDGFQFADGSMLDWHELKEPISTLNVATQLNLFVIVAACVGGAFGRVLTMGDRAPFWGMIGPTRSMLPSELESAYRALYQTLLETKSPAKAIDAFDASTGEGDFWRTTAQGMFQKGWLKYAQDHSSDEALAIRTERMLEMARKQDIQPLPTTQQLEALLIHHEPRAFERFRETFFMIDLFEDHRQRFQVDYVPSRAAL